jgi:hypothetical protein
MKAQFLEQRETRTLQRLHKQLEWLDVLILDELDYMPSNCNNFVSSSPIFRFEAIR